MRAATKVISDPTRFQEVTTGEVCSSTPLEAHERETKKDKHFNRGLVADFAINSILP